MAGENEESWKKKCSVLKRKCDELEQSSEALCWRLVKIQKLIKATESEKRDLMRKLEMYESLELQDDGSLSPAAQPSPQEQKPAPVPLSPPPPPPATKPKSSRKSDQSSRKKADSDPAAPRKPQNAFLRFFQEHKAEYASQAEGEGLARHHDLTKALAKVWGETKPEDKKKYYDMYLEDKERYKREMEEYQRTCSTSS